MTVWYVPIEPLQERYTEQWYRWFPEEFKRQGLEYRVIDGEPLVNEVQVGTFLDVNSTLAYKASQLQKIARLFHTKMIKPGDVFFVADVEFWGIEAIRYLADLNDVPDVKMVGFVHAGSYTREDFFEKCYRYAATYEYAWGKVFDVLCVGSEYHKHRLESARGLPRNKIVVTGNPYDIDEVSPLRRPPYYTKPLRVIHTNRPDHEKRPAAALACFVRLKEKHPNWDFVVTTSQKQWGSADLRYQAQKMQEAGVIRIYEGISKAEYLNILSTSRVMTGNTIEENFGYCLLESLIVNTVPVVPMDYSHPELLQGDGRCMFRQDNPLEQDEKIEAAMAQPFDVYQYAEPYRDSLRKIVQLLH